MADDRSFRRLAALTEVAPDDLRAPARLKSRLYSALVNEMTAEGPLSSLSDSRASGERLCVFEQVLALAPRSDWRSKNPCRVCHARLLAERMDRAPIFWPGCPYSKFHNG